MMRPLRLACLALAGAANARPSEAERTLTPYLTLPASVVLKQRTKHLSEALAPLTANQEGLVPFETTNSSSVGGILHTTGFKINLEGAARLDDGATCGCIPVCSLDDVLSSLSRLPQTVATGSPWAGYLRSIYGDDVPLPFNVSSLELFDLGKLPTQACDMPKCQPSLCAGWLDPEPSDAKAALLAAERVQHRSVFMPTAKVLISQHAEEERRAVNNGSWVEVFRTYFAHEKSGYGCWYWPAKGSGVFLNTGQSIVFPDRHVVNAALDVRFDVCKTSQGDLVRNLTDGACYPDFFWASRARARGADSLQILVSQSNGATKGKAAELVMTSNQCVDQRFVMGPDFPLCANMFGMRRGWRAGHGCPYSVYG